MAEDWVPIHVEHWMRQPAFVDLGLDDRGRFLVLLTMADRHGRFDVNTSLVRVQTGLPAHAADALVAFADGCDLVQTYEVDGRSYGQIVGYDDLLSASMKKRRDASPPKRPAFIYKNAPAQTSCLGVTRGRMDEMNGGSRRDPPMNEAARAAPDGPGGPSSPAARAVVEVDEEDDTGPRDPYLVIAQAVATGYDHWLTAAQRALWGRLDEVDRARRLASVGPTARRVMPATFEKDLAERHADKGVASDHTVH